MKIANRDARAYVQGRQEFKGSNIYGMWIDQRYVVYSYGTHWPLFIYDNETESWYENADKYSVTTSKHHGQCHPHQPTLAMDVEDMRRIARLGAVKALLTPA